MSLGECNSFRTLSLVSLVGAEGPLFKYPRALGLWDVACSLNRSPQEGRAERVLPYATHWERSLGKQKLASTHKEQTVERGVSFLPLNQHSDFQGLKGAKPTSSY